MPDNNNNSIASSPGSQEYPEELKNKAREFFNRGSELAYTLNYDYAIEMYLDGLSYWPDALEEGHKPLREIAFRRQMAGGKKSGFGDGAKWKKASDKHPKDAMLKAEYMLSKDPTNQGHMMDMIKGTVEGNFLETSLWMLDVLFDSNLHINKPAWKTYIFLRDFYIKVNNYPRALQACQLALQQRPNDDALQNSVRDLSAQATMQTGQYDGGGDFTASIKNKEAQEKLQQEYISVKSDDYVADAIAQAQKEYEENPTLPGKISKYVTELCRTEKDVNENKAIEILEKAHSELGQFSYMQQSNEIRIKQLKRRGRTLQKQYKNDPGNKELARQLSEIGRDILQSEIDHYKLCVENFPTDMRMKQEYGKRLMQAKQFDEAIPLLQEARSDPRYRIEALSCIGRCFFFKEWYADAVETFDQALGLLENKESGLGKELLYNLGRAHEEDKNLEEALNYFRKVAQIDFNYLDARNRIDSLRKKLRET
ncbi:MAG: tetratricopeptide repeat protein [Sedimentisphaerales bacterium]|nr:tetratricopeptide repeat protein [Sedimentisphaerales bacterium]